MIKFIGYENADPDLLQDYAVALLNENKDEAVKIRKEIEKSLMFDPHPTQPIVTDSQGIRRFRCNEIVCRLVNECGTTCTNAPLRGLNYICTFEASREDRAQLAQLIGYSVSGYHDLSYAIPVEDE